MLSSLTNEEGNAGTIAPLTAISTFDVLKEVPLITEREKAKEQFERKNLFFRSKDYKLSEL